MAEIINKTLKEENSKNEDHNRDKRKRNKNPDKSDENI